MKTNALSKIDKNAVSVFDDFFKPWNEWFGNGDVWNRAISAPSVNITEKDNEYVVELMAPGQRKKDFNVDVDGNMLTVSSQHEGKTEESTKKFTRKEYTCSSFSRSFTLPEEVDKEKIEAQYEDGVLRITLPRDASRKKQPEKRIAVN